PDRRPGRDRVLPPVGPQVGTADAGGGDPDDSVGRVADPGLRTVLEADVPGGMDRGDAHVQILPAACPVGSISYLRYLPGVTEYLTRIGTLIRSARKHRGWTQQQLADVLSTSQSAVNRIERG